MYFNTKFKINKLKEWFRRTLATHVEIPSLIIYICILIHIIISLLCFIDVLFMDYQNLFNNTFVLLDNFEENNEVKVHLKSCEICNSCNKCTCNFEKSFTDGAIDGFVYSTLLVGFIIIIIKYCTD